MDSRFLSQQIKEKGSFLCVGLDTLVPSLDFNKAVIDATAPYTVAYKPNIAFYEAAGVQGWQILEDTVAYLRRNYPKIFLIADAKRGDIGNTAQQYARAFFERMDFDAVTLAPYMGLDSVAPFLEYKDKWVILLALTSNPSATDFETLPLAGTGKPLYETVITTARSWAGADRMMFVVGATRAEHLGRVRELAPDNFLLVPGVGAQGGSLEAVARYGMNSACGLLVNASRSIIYASKGPDFAQAAGAKAREMALEMRPFVEAL